MLSKLKVKLMMDEDILITTLPNNDDFAFIRSSGQVYVDKTKFIYKLAVDSQPYFFIASTQVRQKHLGIYF